MALPRLIGVVHLPPLAGSPGSHGETPSAALQRAGFQAVREAQLLARAGFEGIILENFGDAPFFKTQVPPETIASLAVIAAAVRESTRLPIGINVLRNDARAALAIAAVTGCAFIRVNVLSGVTATDQGLIEGDAAGLLRERERLHADVAILADVHVKHARSLSSESLELAIEETAGRGGADAVIVSGSTTGRAASAEALLEASRAARACGVPLYVGSGATAASARELRARVDGVIVSSSLRRASRPGAPLDPKRAREFVGAWRRAKPARTKR
jgi:membrane complex biogenesis BtpA family protein